MLTGASHTTAVTAKPKKKNNKKFLLFVDAAAVPEAATSVFQTLAQSGVRGAAVPGVRRQMEADFLLCGFTGAATVECESRPASRLDRQRKRAARPKLQRTSALS